jgi:hypothetical protein
MPADRSQPVATSPDSEYTLTIDEAAARYEHAGHPRTSRSIQRYCAKGHLDSRRIETPFGEKYLITAASVAKHIAYIEEVRPVAAGPDMSRQDVTGVVVQTSDRRPDPSPKSPDLPRPVATAPDQPERYVARLEGEVAFLREEISTKNAQIKELTERSRETNLLIGGLQRLLAPLLGSRDPYPEPTDGQRPTA